MNSLIFINFLGLYELYGNYFMNIRYVFNFTPEYFVEYFTEYFLRLLLEFYDGSFLKMNSLIFIEAEPFELRNLSGRFECLNV